MSELVSHFGHKSYLLPETINGSLIYAGLSPCVTPFQATGCVIDRLPSHLKAVNIQITYVAKLMLEHTNFKPLCSSDSS